MPPGWNISITGTDINLAFLSEARAATYREWVLRDVDESIREEPVSRKLESGRFELLSATRNRVSFDAAESVRRWPVAPRASTSSCAVTC